MSSDRRFLMLQGPHGPFFAGLGRALRGAGCAVWRVGFNPGDRAFWPHRRSYLPYTGAGAGFEGWLDRTVGRLGITDIVLYGDVRPHHAAALAVAARRGLTPHVFEEGYLRPYWVTYERGPANGRSPLADMPLTAIRAALGPAPEPLYEVPAHWGDMREHVFYGALYHACLLWPVHRYRQFRSHRDVPVAREALLYGWKLLTMPLHAARRIVETARFRSRAAVYHLALLQLEHDSNQRAYSPFPNTAAFADAVIAGFERGAPPHHHLVFKAHPLEDGRVPIRRHIRRAAATRGLSHRVHFLSGGKLAPLLDGARSVLTVNSTAAQQALWRGLPLMAYGRSVYDKPGLVSAQTTAAFFARPDPPDREAYLALRAYMLKTSQFPGGYYSRRGRRVLLSRIVDAMLDPLDRYARQAAGQGAATGQHFRILR